MEAQAMEAERWQNVERIYHSALQRDGSQRRLFLDQECAADQTLRREVESLLKYAQQPATFFEMPALEVVAKRLADDLRAGDQEKPDKMIGARIAQYRVLEKLGEGGMGDVYRAVRADDAYEKQVAIKLVRQGLDSEFVYHRFRKERQILAGFEHENIARLLDGGTTDEGYPYFVMELVEGQPIDDYCDERRLGTETRLDLFRQVCSAVQYAHQRLVVHRDIKPSNILVTADGVPKLLDFGIATILSAESYSPVADPTVTVQRMMTPQYASPEQLRGEVITTASDVYSLGMVLYKLLTGHSPYRLETNSPYDLAHAICEVEPERPSTAVVRLGPITDRKIVAGEIGERQIVNRSRQAPKATQEWVSSCRNTSPEKLRRKLSGDLDQILLKALRKEPQRRYGSAQDFAEDLRSYAFGLPVSARRGTFSYRSGKFIRRNKLALAVTAVFALVVLAGAVAIIREERIAERRFNDVRKLANSLLFDIHDSIRDLPGSTAARKLLVDRALQYLDSLSREAAGAPGLQHELASAYERVGDVQGNPYYANLGDTAGATESYRKALQIRLALAGDKRGSPADRAALAGVYVKLGFALRAANNFPAAFETLQRAYPITQQLADAQKDNPQAQDTLAGVCFAMAQCLADMGDVTGSIDYYRKSAAIREAIVGGSPAFQAGVRTRLAGVYGYMAGVEHLRGNLDAAVSLQGKAHDILAPQVQADPQNARLQQFILENEYWTGYYLAEKGSPAQALPHLRAALSGYQRLTSADPQDVLAMRYLGKSYMSMGKALAAEGKASEGIQSAREAVRILEALVAADRGDTAFKPSDLAYADSSLAEAYSRLAEQRGLSTTTKVASWREARSWYQKSLNTWLLLNQKAPLAKFDGAQPDQIAAQISRCDKALSKATAPTL
jgi:non-specific serine/threonine protein kinase/serine/threonine-protein kinase